MPPSRSGSFWFVVVASLLVVLVTYAHRPRLWESALSSDVAERVDRTVQSPVGTIDDILVSKADILQKLPLLARDFSGKIVRQESLEGYTAVLGTLSRGQNAYFPKTQYSNGSRILFVAGLEGDLPCV